MTYFNRLLTGYEFLKIDFEWDVVDSFRQFTVRNIRHIDAPIFSHKETPNNH
jgi:hypothetical protein